MDIEKLTKGELITAALLISFVTAILVGAVIMFLSEDVPADVIRVSERVISSEEGTAAATTTNSADNPSPEEKERTRDELLAAATKAVARVTASSVLPRAGVLLRFGGELAVVTTQADTSSGAEALFQDGVIASLTETSFQSGELQRWSVTDVSGPVSPLSVSASQNPAFGESLFVVPLSELPQIITVTVESTSADLIRTTADPLPAVSLLLSNSGTVVGVYDPEAGAFRSISTFVAQ